MIGPPRSACGAPLKGRRQRPGKAGSAASAGCRWFLRRGRRAAWLGLFAALALAGCAAPCTTAACAAAPQVVRLADGVYMLPGTGGLADEANLGRIGNAGFIVGDAGVIAVDTGTSFAHGQAILSAIRAVTDKPVQLALVTHTRPEFLFGGAAFRARGIPIATHTKTARLMAARCETCLKQLRQTLGEAPMQGTEMYKPDREFDATTRIDTIGRPVRVLHFGHSSGPGDIAVLDERTGVLFGGGLVDQRRIPDIQDAELDGWRRALAALRALRVGAVVPGHGPAASSAVLDAVERYLAQLELRARALVEAGASLIDVPDAIALPEFSQWEQYDTIHRRNASIAYLKIERELFFKQEATP
jgi:glyoxylase-like metal-dependent hydrolase (beta-lactamase superfamily II)